MTIRIEKILFEKQKKMLMIFSLFTSILKICSFAAYTGYHEHELKNFETFFFLKNGCKHQMPFFELSFFLFSCQL